jgi:hypothetical protein
MDIESSGEIKRIAAIAGRLKRVVIRCYQCRHWDGDKVKVQQEYEKNPISLDLFNGWPEEGGCLIEYEWASITVTGNATAHLTVPANFFCPYASV